MRIKLDPTLARKLLSLPESGMGYQRVDVTLEDGREVKNVIAFNAEEVELPDLNAPVMIAEIALHTVTP